MASEHWPGQDAVGQLMTSRWRGKIGVVGDVRHLALEEGFRLGNVSADSAGQGLRSVELVVRSSLSNAADRIALREALLPIAPDLSTSNMLPLQSLVDKAVSPRRFVVMLLGGFAVSR